MGILKKKSCTNGALFLVILGYGLLVWIRHSRMRPQNSSRQSRDEVDLAGGIQSISDVKGPGKPAVLSALHQNSSRPLPLAHRIGDFCLRQKLTSTKYMCKYYAGPTKPQCCCMIAERSELRCLPSFVIIGAQKSGSTALLGYMLLHPAFGPPLKKELHFFDKGLRSNPKTPPERSATSDMEHMFSALGKYLGRFPKSATTSTSRFLTGEATPAYILNRKAPGLMKRLIPDAKLLLVLRDPVDRAYSEWQMKHRRVDSQLNPDDETDVEVLRRLINECAIDRQIEQGDGDANLKDIMKFVKECVIKRCKGQSSNKLQWLGYHVRDIDILLSCLQGHDAEALKGDVEPNLLKQCVKDHRRETVNPFADVVAEEMRFIRQRCMAPASVSHPADIAIVPWVADFLHMGYMHFKTRSLTLHNNDSWEHPHLMRFEWGKCFPSGSTSNIVKDFVVRGLYLEQIKDFHRLYHQDDLLILADQDLRTHTAETVKKVYDFVGLPHRDDVNIPNSTELHDMIDKQYPYFETSSGWHLDSKYPPMAADVRAQLQDFYRPHNLRLNAYLQRDFHWGY